MAVMIEDVSCDSKTIDLFVAGDHSKAIEICQGFCRENPCCVTVVPTTYVHTDGIEPGVIVSFRRYPKYPDTPIKSYARELADKLREGLGQKSSMTSDGRSNTVSTVKE